jgi:hypothetical protein
VPEDKKELESGGVEQLLLDLVGKAAGKGGDSKGSSLPVYVIITGFVCILFAIVGFLAVRAKRRAAQLEYELRKKEEEQKRLVEHAKLEQNAETRAEAESKIDELTVGIGELKEQLEVVGNAAAERTKALAQATSWDDLVIVDKRKT